MDIRKLKAALGDPSESRRKSDEYQNKESKDKFDENSIDEQELADRYNLLEKYGLKEMDEEDVNGILGSYDNDILSNKELENMERTLSRNIHYALMSTPAIKKAAVEVFIENSDELYGIVNVIVEYEPKGFLDRIMGTSNYTLDVETIEIAGMEISEIFKDHPEIVDNFEINLESF